MEAKDILLKNLMLWSVTNKNNMAHKIVITPFAHNDEYEAYTGMKNNASVSAKNF